MLTLAPMQASGEIDALSSTVALGWIPGAGSAGRASPGSSDATTSMNAPRTSSTAMKVWSARNNAQAALRVIGEFGSLDAYFWSFVDGKPLRNRWQGRGDVPARTELSDRLSKDLQKRGFNFVGSTIIYAHMQAVGMVNDHTLDCFRHAECAKKKR